MADEESIHEVEVKSNHEEEFCLFKIRGESRDKVAAADSATVSNFTTRTSPHSRLASLVTGIDYPQKGNGWNFVTVDYSSFNNEHVPSVINISSGFMCDRIADYLEKLPTNTIVLAATAGSVTSGERMSPRCVKAFESIGVVKIEKVRRRVYGISTSVSGVSVRNVAAPNSAAVSNVVNTSFPAIRFARCS